MLGYLRFTVNTSYFCSSRTISTHGFVAFAAGVVRFILFADSPHLALSPFWCQLRGLIFLVGTLCQLRCCPFSLHELRSQLLCQSQQELPPGNFAAGALLEEDVGIDSSKVEDVVKYSHWPSTRTAFHRVCPCHLI